MKLLGRVGFRNLPLHPSYIWQDLKTRIFQKKSNKFGLTWSEVFWPLDVDPGDAVVGVLMVVGFERWLAFQKLEAEDTKGPKVDFFVVVFT